MDPAAASGSGPEAERGSFMRQLYIQEPWANLGYESQAQILNDLMIRIQVLEKRIRQLEEQVSERIDVERIERIEVEVAGVGS